jgi:thioesterase domain-containing protein
VQEPENVELARVESALSRLPGVRSVAVTERRTDRGVQITAWVVRRKGRAPDVFALRRALREGLPAPGAFCRFAFVDALPRTPDGEPDRSALLLVDGRHPAPETNYRAPCGAAEEKIAAIFAEALGLERVGAGDDFFDRGGSLLDAQEAVLRLAEAFGREVDASEFLGATTPAALALRITGPPPRAADSLVPLRRGNGLPVFFIPAPLGVGGVLFAYSRLARRVREGRPFLAFHPGDRAPSSVADLVEAALRTIRAAQSHGPYALVGECAGGILAWEMARRLSADGEQVDLLALLDTPWPPYWRQRAKSPLRRFLAPWGDDLLRRAEHHLRALGDLSVPRWPGYLWEESVVARAAFRRSRRPEVAESLRRREWYAGSLRRMPLKPWGGHLRYGQSADPLHRQDATGWGTLAGSIEVVHVRGEHRNYLGDHVNDVAAALSSWLSQA